MQTTAIKKLRLIKLPNTNETGGEVGGVNLTLFKMYDILGEGVMCYRILDDHQNDWIIEKKLFKIPNYITKEWRNV